jgi:UPF0755 protein
MLRLALFLLVLVAGAAVGGYLYVDRVNGTPMNPAAEPLELTVPKGASLAQVGSLLEAQGLIRGALFWRLHLRLHPGAPRPTAGRHQVSAAMDVPALLQALAGPPIPDDVPLTLVEGWRIRDTDAFLAGKGLIEAGAYLRAAQEPARFSLPFPFEQPTLEGYLYPETYMVPPGPIDVERLIARQVSAFHERFVVPHAQEIERSGRTLHELVVMASMLEREEPEPATRPQVAGVLFKRLSSKMALGVDATSRYGLEDWNDRVAFLKRLRDPADPYNTRLKLGLPPGPIGAPSLPSLLAALRPVDSPYWYYLHDAEKKIHFGKDAAEHEANRRRYDVW